MRGGIVGEDLQVAPQLVGLRFVLGGVTGGHKYTGSSAGYLMLKHRGNSVGIT